MNSDAVARQITGAERVILDRCGHVSEIECAPSFEKTLIDFLSVQVK